MQPVSPPCLCIAGVAEDNTAVSATSESLYDVTMPELALVLLPQTVPPPPKFDKRSPEWLQAHRAAWLERQKKRLHCLLASAACQQRPWKPIADAAVQHGNTQDWQVGRPSLNTNFITNMIIDYSFSNLMFKLW